MFELLNSATFYALASFSTGNHIISFAAIKNTRYYGRIETGYAMCRLSSEYVLGLLKSVCFGMCDIWLNCIRVW